MDTPTIFTGGSVGVALSCIVWILYRVNHKRCRSRCCGRNVEVSVDVENTTPRIDERRPQDQADSFRGETPRQTPRQTEA